MHQVVPNILVLAILFLAGCERSSRQPSVFPLEDQQATPIVKDAPPITHGSEYQLFLEQTGLEIPQHVDVMHYASGWDERFLVLHLSRPELEDLLSRLPVKETATLPRMNGMGVSIPEWWRPEEINAESYFEGRLEWETGAIGKVMLLVENADTPRVFLWAFKG